MNIIIYGASGMIGQRITQEPKALLETAKFDMCRTLPEKPASKKLAKTWRSVHSRMTTFPFRELRNSIRSHRSFSLL